MRGLGLGLALAALWVAAPVGAEDIDFNGRTLTIATDQATVPITGMASTHYAIRLSKDQIVARARECLYDKDNVRIDTVDAEQGVFVAAMSVPFRARGARGLQSRLTLAAQDGDFKIDEAQLMLISDGDDGTVTAPLSQNDKGWEKGLDALIQVENKLVDCLYK